MVESKESKKKLLAEANKANAEAYSIRESARKTKVSKLKELVEIEELEQRLILNRLEAKATAKSEKTTGILCKMMILANVMSTTYSPDSNLGQNKLFSEDELYPYKAKMLELLKQL